MKIALVLPFGRSEEQAKLAEGLGLAFLETKLLEEGHDVTLLNAVTDPTLRYRRQSAFDQPADPHAVEARGDSSELVRLPGASNDAEVAADRVAEQEPDVCGISLVYLDQQVWTKSFCDRLKIRYPRCHIVLGGMYPTSAWRTLLAEIESIDSVCLGEGDVLILELLRELNAGRPLEIDGLATRDWLDLPGLTISETRRSTRRLSGFEMTSLSLPARSQLPRVVLQNGVAQLESSRGCSAGCKFCDARHTTWRPYDVRRVVDEFALLAENFPGVLIYVVDNIFLGFSSDGSHLERGRALAEEIRERGVKVRFVVQDRAANVDGGVFAALKLAGLASVYLGIESFSDTQLIRLGKGVDATRGSNMGALRTLNSLEIYTQFGFLPFDGGTSFDELTETISGLADTVSDLSYVHLSNLNEVIPYPGTSLAREYLREFKQDVPLIDPWDYSDWRVWEARTWMWRLSTALWPLTSLVFNSIQDQDFQRDLWRTLAAKNRGMAGYCVQVLENDDSGRSMSSKLAHFFGAVESIVSDVSVTLNSWTPALPKTLMASALTLVDAYAAVQSVPMPQVRVTPLSIRKR